MANYTYRIEYAKTGRAMCKFKDCKSLIDAGAMRLGRCAPSYFHDDVDVTWYHLECGFKALLNTKATTRVPDSTDLIDGYDMLEEDDKEKVSKEVDRFLNNRRAGVKIKPAKKSAAGTPSKAQLTLAETLPAKKTAKVPSPAKPATPNASAAATTPKAKVKAEPAPEEPKFDDTLHLKQIIPDPWYNNIGQVLVNQEGAEERLGPESDGVVPTREDVFDQLRGLQPSKVQLVVVGPPVAKNSRSASPYCCHDASVKNWGDKLTVPLKHLITAALEAGVSGEGGKEEKIEKYAKNSVQNWFSATKEAGVLWLPSAFTANIRDKAQAAELDQFWVPVILAIIKAVFKAKLTNNPSEKGLVVVFLGQHLEPIQTMALKLYAKMTTEAIFPLRFVEVPNGISSGEKPFLTSEGENPLLTANSLLSETNNTPINWRPESEAAAANQAATAQAKKAGSYLKSSGSKEKAEAVATTTSSAAAPVFPALDKLALQALDKKAMENGDIFFSKAFDAIKLGATTTSVVLRKIHVNNKDTKLTGEIARISKPTADSIQVTPLCDNMYLYKPSKADPFEKLGKNKSYSVSAGDCLSFLHNEYSYRLVESQVLTALKDDGDAMDTDEPKEATPPPKAKKTGKSASTLASDEAVARALQEEFNQESESRPKAKRKASGSLSDGETDDWDDALKPPSKKRAKKADDSDESDDADWSAPKGKGSKKAVVSDDSSSEAGLMSDDEELVASKPLCRYGKKCYRESASHFAQFAHPWRK